jgi:hypothetical protein
MDNARIAAVVFVDMAPEVAADQRHTATPYLACDLLK